MNWGFGFPQSQNRKGELSEEQPELKKCVCAWPPPRNDVLTVWISGREPMNQVPIELFTAGFH
jgi:hypothetical protein